MSDPFRNNTPEMLDSAWSYFAITPNDSADLAYITRGINVAISGNVKVTGPDGSIATLYLVAGIIHPMRVQRLWATNTTATGIVGVY